MRQELAIYQSESSKPVAGIPDMLNREEIDVLASGVYLLSSRQGWSECQTTNILLTQNLRQW